MIEKMSKGSVHVDYTEYQKEIKVLENRVEKNRAIKAKQKKKMVIKNPFKGLIKKK